MNTLTNNLDSLLHAITAAFNEARDSYKQHKHGSNLEATDY